MLRSGRGSGIHGEETVCKLAWIRRQEQRGPQGDKDAVCKPLESHHRQEEMSPGGRYTKNGVGFFFVRLSVHSSVHASILSESCSVLGIEDQQGMTS